MMLFWRIRCFDRTDKSYKDRQLYLDTDTLDPAVRAAVEFVVESKASRTDRAILKYRHVFYEGDFEVQVKRAEACGQSRWVGPGEYFEDETGKEITQQEIAQIRTGNPNVLAIPHGAQQHDIDLMLAEPKPMPVAEVTLTTEETRLLGYFVRDLAELERSAFMKDGPGSINGVGSFLSPAIGGLKLKTAVTDDEIRSFVTIFRRLYMTGPHDPASFLKIVKIFAKALGDHPKAIWVEGVANEYEAQLAAPPDVRPLVQPGQCTFKTKLLIDVFLYTQYAHQPNEQRQREFKDCLNQVKGQRDLLTWMFLVEIWKCAIKIGNAGREMARWFKRYCNHHGITPDVLDSLRDHHAGIGETEKEEDRKSRLFEKKAEQLALALHEQHGRPPGGHHQFLAKAREQLNQVLRKET